MDNSAPLLLKDLSEYTMTEEEAAMNNSVLFVLFAHFHIFWFLAKSLKLGNMTGAHVSLLQKDDTQAPVPLQEPIHVLFMLAEY